MLDPKAVKQWRRSHDLTQREVAEKAGMSLNAYSLFERGKTARMLPLYEKNLQEAMNQKPEEGSLLNERESKKENSGTTLTACLATEFRAIADVLDSTTVSSEIKAKKFSFLVMQCIDLFQSYCEDIKNGR